MPECRRRRASWAGGLASLRSRDVEPAIEGERQRATRPALAAGSAAGQAPAVSAPPGKRR